MADVTKSPLAPPPARRLILLGIGVFAEEITDLVREIPGWEVVGYALSIGRPEPGTLFNGRPVHWIDELPTLAADHWAVCGIGTTRRAGFVAQVEAMGFRFATLVHPTARVSPSTSLGAGTIVSTGAIIASHTTLGRHVIVNRGALIGHHTHIGDCTTVGPGANIAGLCRIGAGTYLGMGSLVLDRMAVGTGSVVGAGSVVTRPVPEHVQVIGMPAKIVKEGVNGY